jgi:hypothetical protein
MKPIALFLVVLLSTQTVMADGLWPPEGAPQEKASIVEPIAQVSEPTTAQEAPEVKAAIKKAFSNVEFERFITVDKQIQPLTSKLSKMYTAYKVTITSDYPGTLAIKNANINNGVPGTVAAKVVRKSPWGGMGWALIPYVGIIAGPAVSINRGVKNGRANKEAANYASQVPVGDLHKGEPISFNALVPAGQTPVLTIKFVDKEAEQEYILSSI